MPPKQWMLKKPAKALPTLASIEAHLASGNLAAAAIAVRQLHQNEPSPESLALSRRIVLAQAHSAIDRKHAADFEQAFAAATKLVPDDAAWQTERAMLLAQWGQLPQALMLLPADANEATRLLAVAHAADRSIRFKSYAGLPDEHHEGCKNTILAFAKYERGEDDAARELLQGIGLQSPFLEWKLLLRGLMAFAVNDDAKALENWQRLNPVRLPARLAAPLRTRIDSAFRNAQSPPRAAQLHEQARQLTGSKSQAHLIALQKIVGQHKPLHTGWKQIEAAWAALKPSHPDLAARFANCIYQAILRQGQPDDLTDYRRIFGRPQDDPDFHRLQAMVLEMQDQIVLAIACWEKYERWLGTKPAGWEISHLQRARSLVLERVGNLAAEELDHSTDQPDFREALETMFGGAKREKLKKSPGEYFQQAITADPAALSPRLALLRYLAEAEPTEKLVAVAREALALAPGNLEVLNILATALQKLRRPGEALEYRKQALAANPLDPTLAMSLVQSCLAASRQAMIEGRFADAEKILDEHSASFAGTKAELSAALIRSTLYRKAGGRDEANAIRDRLMQSEFRLAAAFTLSVDAALAKLKPAEKTAANKLLMEAMKAPANLREVLMLQAVYAGFEINGMEYRGQKTFPKKIEGLLEAATKLELTAEECDHLLLALEAMQNWKLAAKICERLLERFPKNPRVRVMIAKSLLQGRPAWKTLQRIRGLLLVAKELAGQTESAENRKLLDEIESMLSACPDPFDFDIPFLFGR